MSQGEVVTNACEGERVMSVGNSTEATTLEHKTEEVFSQVNENEIEIENRNQSELSLSSVTEKSTSLINTYGAGLANSSQSKKSPIMPPSSIIENLMDKNPKTLTFPVVSSDHNELAGLCCAHIHRSGTPPPDGQCCYHRCRPNWTLEEREKHHGKEPLPQINSSFSFSSSTRK